MELRGISLISCGPKGVGEGTGVDVGDAGADSGGVVRVPSAALSSSAPVSGVDSATGAEGLIFNSTTGAGRVAGCVGNAGASGSCPLLDGAQAVSRSNRKSILIMELIFLGDAVSWGDWLRRIVR